MKSNEGQRSPELDAHLKTLRNSITSGGERLRDCFRTLHEELIGGSKKKASFLPLISHATQAALEFPNPTALLLRALEFMPFRPTPEMVLLGSLQVDRSPARDDLLYELVGCLDSPVSPKLSQELEKSLAKDFPWFPVVAWDRNGLRHSDPSWCRVWGSLCQQTLQSLNWGYEKRAPEVLENMVARIEPLHGKPAEALGPLVLYLFSQDFPRVNKGIRDRIVTTAAAQQARLLIAGQNGESLLPASDSNSTDASRIAPVTSGPPTFLEGLSPSVIHAISVLCEELQTHGREVQRITQKREQLELKCSKLQAEREECVIRLNEVQDKLARADESLRETRGVLRQEQETTADFRTKMETSDRMLDSARLELAQTERDLRAAQDAYHRLDSQTMQEKSDLKSQIITRLHLELNEPWEMMALMLGMVVRGERESRHLLSMWNQFDETLTQLLGREIGHPVHLPPARD